MLPTDIGCHVCMCCWCHWIPPCKCTYNSTLVSSGGALKSILICWCLHTKEWCQSPEEKENLSTLLSAFSSQKWVCVWLVICKLCVRHCAPELCLWPWYPSVLLAKGLGQGLSLLGRDRLGDVPLDKPTQGCPFPWAEIVEESPFSNYFH